MAIRGKSAREFSIDLKKFGKVTHAQAEQIFRRIALELDQLVVLGTPVDLGRARGNWFPSIATPSSLVDEEIRDKSGGQAIAKVQGIVAGAKLGESIWLTNNLPYILPLENGHSQKQAPQGMVDVNVEKIAAQLGGKIVR
jgi:hypothetical protein